MFKRLFRFPWRTQRDIARDFDAELSFHVEERSARLIASGIPAAEARAQALRELGDVDDARRYVRDVDQQAESGRRRKDFVRELLQDFRYAGRRMRAAPFFSAVAVLSLAIAIGVNATAFSLVDSLFFRDLPGVERYRELSAVLVTHGDRNRRSFSTMSVPEWEVYRDAISGFSGTAVLGSAPVAVRYGGEPRVVRGDFVSGGYFAMLGTRPAAGRLLTPDDDRPGAPAVAVISHNLWLSDFGGRSDAIGETVHLGRIPFTVVGVAPEGFIGLYPGELDGDLEQGSPQVTVALASAPLVRLASRATDLATVFEDDWLMLTGRRREGVSTREAQAQADLVAARLSAAYPAERPRARAEVRHPSTGTPSELAAISLGSMALPVLILLVACANLANQLLAMGVRRAREIAVRLSLGATRGRLIRQLLVECTLLTLLAAIGGIALARLLIDFVGTTVIVMPFHVPIDARVVAFTIVLTAVTALAFGLLPALRATRMDLAQAVKDGGRAGSWRASRLRDGLVVVQVAACVALIALAGVFVRGSQRARISDVSGNSDKIVTMAFDLNLMGMDSTAGRAFQTTAADRLRAVPGVAAVAIAPFKANEQAPYQAVRIEGDPPDRRRWEHIAEVSDEWFRVQNSLVVAGRLYTEAEARSDAAVAVVDEALAQQYWPGKDPIGQSLTIGEPCDPASATSSCYRRRAGATDGVAVRTVIGVIPTFINARNEEPSGLILTPAPETYRPRSVLYARATGSAAALKPTVREVMRTLDPRLPLRTVETLGEALDDRGKPVAQMAAGVGAMGVVTLLLAALGLAAMLSFMVEQRRYEIGVRMALGAQPSVVTRMVMRRSLALVGVGAGVGAVLAAAGAIVVRGILFGLPPIDPLAFAGSTAIILIVALAASAGPARRAAKVDPLIALRSD